MCPVSTVRGLAASLGLSSITLLDRLLSVDRFPLTPSSIDKHHAWEGGNMEHTFEVAILALSTADLVRDRGHALVNF